MRIASWNVNSLRVREDQVLDWLEAHEPDVLCLQETKVTDQAFPEDAFFDLDYEVSYWGQSTYNGVAIVSREVPSDVIRGFPGGATDAEPRLMAATIQGVRIINVYVPNGAAMDSSKFAFKLEWLKQLRVFLDDGPPSDTPLALMGDFNIAPLDLDVWAPDEMAGGLFVSKPERAAFFELLEWGLSDAFRHFQPSQKAYTWWDYRKGGFERNRGMRIDHMLITKPLLERAEKVWIDRQVRSLDTPSDHVPVVLDCHSEPVSLRT